MPLVHAQLWISNSTIEQTRQSRTHPISGQWQCRHACWRNSSAHISRAIWPHVVNKSNWHSNIFFDVHFSFGAFSEDNSTNASVCAKEKRNRRACLISISLLLLFWRLMNCKNYIKKIVRSHTECFFLLLLRVSYFFLLWFALLAKFYCILSRNCCG